jgi:hypothetical protein
VKYRSAVPISRQKCNLGAQYFFTATWSFTAKFDGEFAAGSQTYGGTGTLHYTW